MVEDLLDRILIRSDVQERWKSLLPIIGFILSVRGVLPTQVHPERAEIRDGVMTILVRGGDTEFSMPLAHDEWRWIKREVSGAN